MKAVYNKTSETAQDRINKIIFDNHLNESEIARILGKAPQTLHYQLHEAVNLDRETEQGIFIYLRSVGIIQYQVDECSLINDTFLDFTSIITQQISILSNTIRKTVSDDQISDEERIRLLIMVKNLRIETDKKINDLDAIVNGRVK